LREQSDWLENAAKDIEESHTKIEHAYQEWMDALDIVSDPIFMHDRDCKIIRCNRAYQQLAGMPFKHIIGRHYFDIFPKTHTPMQYCVKAMEDPSYKETEIEIKIGKCHYRSCAYSLWDDNGDYRYSVHLLEDITEQKTAMEALRISEKKHRLLFESSRDALMMLAPPTWKFTDANQATVQLFRASDVAEFTSLGPWNVSPQFQPDGRHSGDGTRFSFF
jgi:PAS domain S-box-containing protein